MRHLYDSGASPFIPKRALSTIYCVSGLIGMLMHKSTHNASGTAATTGMVPATLALIAKEFTGAH